MKTGIPSTGGQQSRQSTPKVRIKVGQEKPRLLHLVGSKIKSKQWERKSLVGLGDSSAPISQWISQLVGLVLLEVVHSQFRVRALLSVISFQAPYL